MGVIMTSLATRAVHDSTACKASRHARVQHLITADENALAELEALIATLPICSTGRVFVEVPDASWIAPITVPARMVLTWLDRSARSGEPGTGRACAPGQALSRAVTAWADEMLCDDAVSDEAAADDTDGLRPASDAACVDGTRIHLLGGFLGTADIFDHLTERLGIAAAAVHTPARFGLVSSR